VASSRHLLERERAAGERRAGRHPLPQRRGVGVTEPDHALGNDPGRQGLAQASGGVTALLHEERVE